MKLEDIATVKVGVNITRLKEEEYRSLDTYSFDDLIEDLNGLFLDSKVRIESEKEINESNHLSQMGELIFSFVSSKASIVSETNAGKLINQNFAKLIIDHEELDHRYLCYILNESHEIKKQMAISMQGSTVRKLTPITLKELEIKLPSIEKQRIIGKAYLSIKKRHALAKKQAELEEKLYLEILKKLDQS